MATIVFIDTKKDDWNALPKAVQTGLSHEDAGRFIPKITFTDIKTRKHILSVKYEDWRESSKTMERIKESLKEEEPKQPAFKKEPKPKPKIRQYRTWKNIEGKKIRAQFVGLSDGIVTLKILSGKKTKYPLHKLSDDSQSLAKSLNEK